jgi:hypothetical protein
MGRNCEEEGSENTGLKCKCLRKIIRLAQISKYSFH